MELERALPILQMLYRSNQLVPFFGSGMSMPACTDWKIMIQSLERSAGMASKARAMGDSDRDLVRRADRAIIALSHLSVNEIGKVYRKSLWTKQSSEIPAQMKALCQIPWSFAITTNYDDLFVHSASWRPRILGRSVSDCRQVLSSLSFPSDPILWTIQGYVGEICTSKKFVDGDSLNTLINEVVIGHQHYQDVIHANPFFRRTFAEVFRNKSFLFLGSGLQEDYVLNLFGEILINYRESKLPHFAILCQPTEAHKAFLKNRLSINVIEIKHYDDLPLVLKQLGKHVEFYDVWKTLGAPQKNSYRISERSVFSVERTYFRPEHVGKSVAFAFNAWLTRSSGLQYGGQGEQLEKVLGRKFKKSAFKQTKSPRIFRLDVENIFAVVGHDDFGSKDLREVYAATIALLKLCKTSGVKQLHFGILSITKDKNDHSGTFKFMQMVRAVRDFFTVAENSTYEMNINLQTKDHRIWSLINSNVINIDELLSCSDLRFTCIIEPASFRSHELVLLEPGSRKLGNLTDSIGLTMGLNKWKVTVLPPPRMKHVEYRLIDVVDLTLNELGIVPGGQLIVSQNERD